MSNPLTVAVLGGGSFGTALSNIIATNGHLTRQWMRDPERAEEVQRTRENALYLPGVNLHEGLHVSDNLKECVEGCEVLVISIPSVSFRDVCRQVAPFVNDNCIVVSTTKGIDGDGFYLMSQIIEQEIPKVRIGALSGPNFAKEIVQRQYTGTVIASDDKSVIEVVQKVFSSPTFRIYSSPDRYGVELGGALKNIYAIIAGISSALGSGSNTFAMLLTRSLAEMSRFAREMGGEPITFLGLSGVGDLALTCSSDQSRNYRAGFAIGQGKNLDEALADIGQVVEGINTLKIVKAKAEELNVYMPLVQGLYAILFEKRDILRVVQELMNGEMSSDVDLQGGS